MDADHIAFIRVFMKVYSVNGKEIKGGPQIFFATETSPKLSGDKMLSSSYTLNKDGYAEAVFSCASQPNWKGHVNVFRLDPISGGGSWEIQKIELDVYKRQIQGSDDCIQNIDFLNRSLIISRNDIIADFERFRKSMFCIQSSEPWITGLSPFRTVRSPMHRLWT